MKSRALNVKGYMNSMNGDIPRNRQNERNPHPASYRECEKFLLKEEVTQESNEAPRERT